MTTSHVLEEEAAARGTAEELEESEAVPAGHFDVKSGSVDGPSPPINAEPTANEPPPPPYEEPISADEVAATNTNVQDAPEGHNAGESHLGDNAAQASLSCCPAAGFLPTLTNLAIPRCSPKSVSVCGRQRPTRRREA